jgi:transcriptional regulator MraZ
MRVPGRGRQQFPRNEAVVFVGKSERQLDPKGRLALPATFRPRFEPRCYLSLGEKGCIDVMTPEAFETMASDLMDKVKRGEADRDVLRTLAANTFDVAVDGQGRINVESTLRDYANLALGSRVVVSGAIDRVEIWNADAFVGVEQRGGAGLKGA